jgi:hypothetical protein
MISELGRMCNRAAVASFEVILWHLLGKSEENYDMLAEF